MDICLYLVYHLSLPLESAVSFISRYTAPSRVPCPGELHIKVIVN